jgi:hypothetical protein
MRVYLTARDGHLNRTVQMAEPNSERTGRDDETRRVANEMVSRLSRLGVRLTGAEQPEELLDMVEAIARFEAAVESRGGDLMVDEGPSGYATDPDDPHFALPKRVDRETVGAYLERLGRATDDVRRHPPRAD